MIDLLKNARIEPVSEGWLSADCTSELGTVLPGLIPDCR